MPGSLQPLVNNQPIVRSDGTPTEYFIRWAQQKQIDIQGAVTAEQALEIAQAYVDDFLAAHPLSAGSGITLTPPDGNLGHNISIRLGSSCARHGRQGASDQWSRRGSYMGNTERRRGSINPTRADRCCSADSNNNFCGHFERL
jgi:hypothetical protein